MSKGERFYDDYFQDILDAIEKALAFTDSMTFKYFSTDDKTAYAVIRALEIIGEAPKRFRRKNALIIPIFLGRKCPACETNSSTIILG